MFQRAESQPDAPDSTWEPATESTRGTYNGTDGWEVTVPDGTDQLWESEGFFDPSAQTGIAADDWSAVFQAGAEGPAGPQGPAGPAGVAAKRYVSSSEDETYLVDDLVVFDPDPDVGEDDQLWLIHTEHTVLADADLTSLETSLELNATRILIGDKSIHSYTGVTSPPCLLYTSPSPRDRQKSRMPSSA